MKSRARQVNLRKVSYTKKRYNISTTARSNLAWRACRPLRGRRTYLDARMKNDVSRRENEDQRISTREWRSMYLGARTKNDVSWSVDEERRILARRWRTTYLAAKMKNDVSQRCYDQYTANVRRNTSFFIRVPRYVLLLLSRRCDLFISSIWNFYFLMKNPLSRFWQ